MRKGDDVAVIDQGRKSKEAWATLKFRCQQLTKKAKKNLFPGQKVYSVVVSKFFVRPKTN